MIGLGCDAGGTRQTGGLDTPQAADLDAEALDFSGTALDDDRFQAGIVIEVHVGRAQNIDMTSVLDVDQALGELALMVIVADR